MSCWYFIPTIYVDLWFALYQSQSICAAWIALKGKKWKKVKGVFFFTECDTLESDDVALGMENIGVEKLMCLFSDLHAVFEENCVPRTTLVLKCTYLSMYFVLKGWFIWRETDDTGFYKWRIEVYHLITVPVIFLNESWK